MKFSTIVCCGLIAAASASAAVAEPYQRGTGAQPLVQDQRSRPGRERETERPARERRQRGLGEEDRSRGHMSPQERRQLRRDIQDAGRDIYHRERRGRGDGRRSK